MAVVLQIVAAVSRIVAVFYGPELVDGMATPGAVLAWNRGADSVAVVAIVASEIPATRTVTSAAAHWLFWAATARLRREPRRCGANRGFSFLRTRKQNLLLVFCCGERS